MNIGIMWFLRWIPITAAPLLIFVAIAFMIPGFWQYIASMWLSKRGRKIFVNRWWLRIPPLGIGLMFLGWVVSVICHALSACLLGFDFLLNLINIRNENFVIDNGTWKKSNLLKLYQKAQTPFDWHFDAFKLAKKFY